ncbi:MAG: hypothetical protein AAFY72_14215 [Cyanobacteria bacterium J06649_4]
MGTEITTDSAPSRSNNSTKDKLIWAMFCLFGGACFLFSGGWIFVVMIVYAIANNGWQAIGVDEFQRQTVHSISFGEREATFLLSDYEFKEDYGPVTVTVSVTDSVKNTETTSGSDTTLAPLTSFYNNDWRAMGERETVYYKLKDVDGDWKKDLLLRVEHSFSETHYYISSRDGNGYKTNEKYKSREPWVE